MDYHNKDKDYEGLKIGPQEEGVNIESSGSYICGPVKLQNSKVDTIGGISSTDTVAMECVADNNFNPIGVNNFQQPNETSIGNISSSETSKLEGFNVSSNELEHSSERLTGNPLDIGGFSVNSVNGNELGNISSSNTITANKAIPTASSSTIATGVALNSGNNSSSLPGGNIEGVSNNSVSKSGFDIPESSNTSLDNNFELGNISCLLYTSPSPRDA